MKRIVLLLAGLFALQPLTLDAQVYRVDPVPSFSEVRAYEWNEHPLVKEKIGQLAKAEYEAGGSDKVAKKIENMSSDELKTYLIKSVRENMNLGIEILNGGE